MKNEQQVFKVMLLGTAKKLEMFWPLMDNTREPDYINTIGVQYTTIVIETEVFTVKLVLWDVSSDTKFQSYNHLYYKDAEGAIIVEDDEQKITILKERVRHANQNAEIIVLSPQDPIEGILEELTDRLLKSNIK